MDIKTCTPQMIEKWAKSSLLPGEVGRRSIGREEVRERVEALPGVEFVLKREKPTTLRVVGFVEVV